MLKSLARSEIKEAVILLVFGSLLYETLTTATLLLIVIGAVMVWFRKRPTKLWRNILTLGIFAIYWIAYGKVIDPEVGLNFLTSIIVLKLLEKETERDGYMIFFGLILLISAGSLFEKSISYVVFFTLSFVILIQDFYRNLKLPNRLVNLLGSLIWVLPFTALLFFLAPRVMNPFQLDKGTPKDGEVGYTPDVNITEIESLSQNDRPVFQALVDRPIESMDLYWRGNTLSFSDGWNWPLMPQDRTSADFDSTLRYDESGIKQRIRTFSQLEFYFGFDHPAHFVTPQGAAALTDTKTLSQNRWRPSQRYQVVSFSGAIQETTQEHRRYLRTSLKISEKNWINQTFHSENLPDLQREIEAYFMSQKFSYSLSPGRVENMLEFMREKKIGFCSHYASAVAQILRTKNIPARLVSGFMGGSYNKFAGFYLITQNDAHVWVEAFHDGKWQRLDPTSWIAPDRVRLGGAAYMQQMSPSAFSGLNAFSARFGFISELRQWFNQWDFRFYQWLEEMDYYGQAALFEKLNFKREWIFSFIPVLLALFMGAYAWHLSRNKVKLTELEILWHQFQQKLSKRNISLPLHSIAEGEALLKNQDERVRQVWKELVEASFRMESSISLIELKKKIRDL